MAVTDAPVVEICEKGSLGIESHYVLWFNTKNNSLKFLSRTCLAVGAGVNSRLEIFSPTLDRDCEPSSLSSLEAYHIYSGSIRHVFVEKYRLNADEA